MPTGISVWTPVRSTPTEMETPDFSDCAPADPTVASGAAEVCNGYDDNCDGDIDGPDLPSVTASCEDGDPCTSGEACGAPPPAAFVISEMMVSPQAASDETGEWFELWNLGPEATNIQGWTIESGGGQTHVIDAGGSIFVPAGGYLVLGASDELGDNGGVAVNYAYSDITFDAPADSLVIRDQVGVEVDRVDYDASFPVRAGCVHGPHRPDCRQQYRGGLGCGHVGLRSRGSRHSPWAEPRRLPEPVLGRHTAGLR